MTDKMHINDDFGIPGYLWPDGDYRTTPPDPSTDKYRRWVEGIVAERDRLQEGIGTALQVIPKRYEDLSPVQKSRVIRDVKATLTALQENDNASVG